MMEAKTKRKNELLPGTLEEMSAPRSGGPVSKKDTSDAAPSGRAAHAIPPVGGTAAGATLPVIVYSSRAGRHAPRMADKKLRGGKKHPA